MIVCWVLCSLNFGAVLLAAESDQIIYLNCKYDNPDSNVNRIILLKLDLENKALQFEDTHPRAAHTHEYKITSVTPELIKAVSTEKKSGTLEINRITGRWKVKREMWLLRVGEIDNPPDEPELVEHSGTCEAAEPLF